MKQNDNGLELVINYNLEWYEGLLHHLVSCFLLFHELPHSEDGFLHVRQDHVLPGLEAVHAVGPLERVVIVHTAGVLGPDLIMRRSY